MQAYKRPGMDSVTFVFALATEQERQTEVLKNQNQNQLEKYRSLIQKQKEKERAFLSFKKVKFLSRQEAKLDGKRPASARAHIGDRLPAISQKPTPKKWFLGEISKKEHSTTSIDHQTMRLGIKLASKPNTSETSSEEDRKPYFITLTGSVGILKSSATNDNRERKMVHFDEDAKLLSVRSIPKSKKTSTDDSLKEIENERFGKGMTLQKCERRLVKNICKGNVSDVYSRVKCEDRSTNDHSRTPYLQKFKKAEDTVTPTAASWAVVARLIGLKMKFKRRQLHGTFQAPELEVLDPSLNKNRKTDKEKSSDPWVGVKDCRYLRLPNRK